MAPIGLLVVHGIGNQRPGSLAAKVAALLSASSPRHNAAGSPYTSRNKQSPPATTPEQSPGPVPVKVGKRTVLIHEANWAQISRPDNPPSVEIRSDLQIEFFRTVRSAWKRAWKRFGVANDRYSHAIRRLKIAWLILVAVLILGGLTAGSLGADEGFYTEFLGSGAAFVGFVLLSFSLFFLSGWMYRRLRTGHPWYQLLWMLFRASLIGVVRFCLLFVGTFVLLCLALPVLATYLFNAAGWALAYPFRVVGWIFEKANLRLFARMTYWIGWVMIAMPILSFVESVKASENLLSVLFLERGIMTRVMALLGLVETLIAFALLMVFCEFFIISAVVFFLGSPNADVVMLLLVAVYLLFLRLSLPAIDLVLDIARYHVAASAGRRKYYDRVHEGVSKLESAGCQEIHILAHSLGSVMVYDWLKAARQAHSLIAVVHTIGSPLDKFWYIDHGRDRRKEDKHGLEGRVSRAWVNYWAYSDPVSGALHHYHAPSLPVVNKRMRWLGVFLWSHGRYWHNQEVAESLRQWICDAPARRFGQDSLRRRRNESPTTSPGGRRKAGSNRKNGPMATDRGQRANPARSDEDVQQRREDS